MSRRAEKFLLELARALHRAGTPAQLLEETLQRGAVHFGIAANFFSTPTSIFASFDSDSDQRTYLVRVDPGDIDLGRLDAVDRLRRSVLRGECEAEEGTRRLHAIFAAPPRYGAVATSIAFALASASAARFFGGGLREVTAATLIGLCTGILALVLPRRRDAAPLFEPASALLAAFLGATAHAVIGPMSSSTATLAGLIVLVPGLSLTLAMKELATRHLSSGTARLMGAVVVFVTIGFGVAAGRHLGFALVGASEDIVATPLPAWTEFLALAIAPVCFAVLFRAAPRDVGWIMVAGIVAFLGARLGAAWSSSPELAVCLGATLVGIAGNLFSRLLDRPSGIMLVPGLMLLVPGSLGFRSVSSLLDQDVTSGVSAAFTMLLVASALVAGLLFANAVAPPRRL